MNQSIYSPPPKSIVHKMIELTPTPEKILRPPRIGSTRRRSSATKPRRSSATKTEADDNNNNDSIRQNESLQMTTRKESTATASAPTSPRRRHSSYTPPSTPSRSSSYTTPKKSSKKKVQLKVVDDTTTKTSSAKKTTTKPRTPRRSKSSATAGTSNSSFSTQATARTSSMSTIGAPPADNSIFSSKSSIDNFWSSTSFNNSFDDISLSFEFPSAEFEYDGELNDVVPSNSKDSKDNNSSIRSNQSHNSRISSNKPSKTRTSSNSNINNDDDEVTLYRTITQDELKRIKRKKETGAIIVHIFDDTGSSHNQNISSTIDGHIEHLALIQSTCTFMKINASNCSPRYLERLGVVNLPSILAIRDGIIEAQLSDIYPSLDTLTDENLESGDFINEFIAISGFDRSQSCNNRRSLMDSFRFASFTNRG